MMNMSINVLYLDKLNRHMEKMVMDLCPSEVDLRFLEPAIGRTGAIEDAECLLVTTFHLTAALMDKAPKLRLIQRTGVGVDMVDVAHAKEKNIPVSICKGFNASSVAELAVLDMLALYRRIIALDNLGKKGEWHTLTWRHDSYELVGKTVGVIGGGTIGREVIKRVKAFGTRILYHDVARMSTEDEAALDCTYLSLEQLLTEADILTIHAPLLPSTRGMIGSAQLALMKPTAILINTARTSIVDDVALVEALKNGRLWGAAFDVFEPEDPLFGVDLPNLIVTPHVGAATYDNYYRGYKFCMENAQRIARGEAPLYTI